MKVESFPSKVFTSNGVHTLTVINRDLTVSAPFELCSDHVSVELRVAAGEDPKLVFAKRTMPNQTLYRHHPLGDMDHLQADIWTPDARRRTRVILPGEVEPYLQRLKSWHQLLRELGNQPEVWVMPLDKAGTATKIAQAKTIVEFAGNLEVYQTGRREPFVFPVNNFDIALPDSIASLTPASLS